MLSDLTPQNRADFPGATLLQVRPSASIGNTLSSMLDFSRATIERLIDLGYEDARKTVAEVCELAREIVSLRERGLANEARARSLRDPTP